ncbi:hypothetical protein GCM10007863_41530 [Dyella mobilis]|nr:hypothetical protein GCM10007863_41530 [Dyella mobilis]
MRVGVLKYPQPHTTHTPYPAQLAPSPAPQGRAGEGSPELATALKASAKLPTFYFTTQEEIPRITKLAHSYPFVGISRHTGGSQCGEFSVSGARLAHRHHTPDF